MKLFTLIVFVLAFCPILLDCSLRGRNGKTPTFPLPLGLPLTPPPTVLLPPSAFPIVTYSVVDAFTTGTAVLQVLATAHMAHHNNGAQSGGWADSTVSVWTGSQVNPIRGVRGIRHASLDLAHRHFQGVWSRLRHWCRVGSVRLVDAVVGFILYLLFSIAAAVAILSNATVERPAAVVQSQRKHLFVSSTTPIEGSFECNVNGPVTQKQLSINTFTLEGRLVLSSGTSTSDSPVEWTVLFHPQQYYRSTGPAIEPNNHVAQLDAANKYLLNMLLRGVTAYHPWTWYAPAILVKVPKKLRSVSWIDGAPKSNDNGRDPHRGMIVARAVRKPTFAPSISRIGGPPKPPLPQLARSRKPRHSAPRFEKFTLEGRVLLYAGQTPGQLVKWIIQFDPYSGRHITRHGDDSNTREREFMDGHLLDILLFGGMTQPPSVVSIPVILLDAPGEMVKESNKLAIASNSLDITIANFRLSPSSLRTHDVSTIVDYRVPSIDARVAFIELNGSANAEDLAALDLLEERSSAEAIHETVPAHVGENGEDSTSSNHTSPTSQHIAWCDPTSNPLLREQRPTVLPEHRSLLPVLGEPALQRHAQNAWENGWTEVREQDQVENGTVEEDVQQEAVHQRRKRRGGKKNTAWKNKRRQEKEDHERNPEAGPSGLR
ncbi:hypothetical protein FRC00_002678 [Tulasnella sp. 408]|nr:hypothetical protein FRC00_002678 [Tulasnella sp. 408]